TVECSPIGGIRCFGVSSIPYSADVPASLRRFNRSRCSPSPRASAKRTLPWNPGRASTRGLVASAPDNGYDLAKPHCRHCPRRSPQNWFWTAVLAPLRTGDRFMSEQSQPSTDVPSPASERLGDICDQFEAAWKAVESTGKCPLIEDYLARA